MWVDLAQHFRSVPFFTKIRHLRYLLVLVVLLGVLPHRALGQQGTIVGTVTDPSGAVVPSVTIAITHTDTATTHTFATNEAGQYVAPDLQIGHYNIKASAAGFKAAEQKDIVLNVGDRVRVDFQMQVGTASETVTVEAAAIHPRRGCPFSSFGADPPLKMRRRKGDLNSIRRNCSK